MINFQMIDTPHAEQHAKMSVEQHRLMDQRKTVSKVTLLYLFMTSPHAYVQYINQKLTKSHMRNLQNPIFAAQ